MTTSNGNQLEIFPSSCLIEKVRFDKSILKDLSSNRRLLIDVRADYSPEAMMRFLSYADTVLWCIRPEDAPAAIVLLQGLVKSVPRWRDKIRIVWVLDTKAPMAPYVPELHELAERDFKLTFDTPGANQSGVLEHGFERIIHHLRGIQIGLALGGGAARGMAHLGVLKALEQHGIYIDMISGTSAGAMVGTLYAADLDPDYIAHCFKTDLLPSWIFRKLPGGGYWYLLYKYRLHQFESMLRKYLGQARLEQLTIPTFTVSVDLVEGEIDRAGSSRCHDQYSGKHQSSSAFAASYWAQARLWSTVGCSTMFLRTCW